MEHAALGLCLLLMLPAASAHHLEEDFVADDPEGDYNPIGVGPVTQDSRLDITQLWIGHETESHLSVGIVTADMDPSTLPIPPKGRDRSFDVSFERNGSTFRIEMLPGHEDPDEPCEAFLAIRAAGEVGFARHADCLDLTANGADDGGFTVDIPRDWLSHEMLAAPQPGDEIRPTEAGSSRMYSDGDSVDMEGTFMFTAGQVQTGGLVVSSSNPIRASNGEATTIIFDLRIQNPHDEAVRTALSSQTAESTFQVRVPDLVVVPARSAVTVPIILAMGSAHSHGEAGRFDVIVSPIGSDVPPARFTYAINWLEVPQPSAHHPTLYLHAREQDTSSTVLAPFAPLGWTSGWMNTLKEDPDRGDTGADLQMAISNRNGHGYADLTVNLRPNLLLGLSLEAGQAGTFTGRFTTPLPMPNAVASVELFARCIDDCPPSAQGLVESGESAVQDLGVNQPTTMTFNLTAPAAGVFIRPVQTGILQLNVSLSWDQAGPMQIPQNQYSSPRLSSTGTSFTMPYREFHENLRVPWASNSTLSLGIPSPIRYANPGDQIVFDANVTSAGDSTLLVDLVSPHNGMFTPSRPVLSVQAGATQALRIGAMVPMDAAPNTRYDAVVVIYDKQNPWLADGKAITLVVVAESERAIPSESFATDVDTKQSPAGLLPLVVAVVVWARRRMG